MAKPRTPKYIYCLLESPMTSYFSSSGNELATTHSVIETGSQNDGNTSSSISGTKIPSTNAFRTNVAAPSPDATNISHISSIAGGQRAQSTERTYTSDTIFASGEDSTHDITLQHGTPRTTIGAGGSTSHVFQMPTAPPPRKTPRSLPIARIQSTPRSKTTSISSAGSRMGKSAKKTPRSCRSDVTDTPRGVDTANIVSIVEGRGQAKGDIGMASIDLKHPVVEISQFADSQTYVKTLSELTVLAPVEILFPNTMCDAGNMVKLFSVVSNNFKDTKIMRIQRQYFNESIGMEFIKNLSLKEHNSVEMDVQRKYYCLAATAALIKYVEYIENTMFASHSLKMVYRGSDQTTSIDSKTAAILELVINAQDPRSTDSLYGLLNRTQTLGGARCLRSNILQPPNGIATIAVRQDSIDELAANKELFFGLKECLARFDFDLDSLLTSIVTIPKRDTDKIIEGKITSCILLKHILQLIPVVENILCDGDSQLFRAYTTQLQDARFGSLLEKIVRVIQEGAKYQKGHLNMRNQKCFAVRDGINGFLDAARRTYSELIEDVTELTNQLAELHNLPLKSAYNASRGFFIQMPIPDKGKNPPRLPAVFMKVTSSRSLISCTTDDLICMNGKIKTAVTRIYEMANEVVSDLLAEVRGMVGCLYKLSEIISMLDVLVSLTQVAAMSNYVRPQFTDTLAIKQGRHPILEKIKLQNKAVPNDIYASEETNFLFLTGPNMSGKSTLLKQIALLQVRGIANRSEPGI